MELMLLSNSSSYGKKYFSFAAPLIRKFLLDKSIKEVLFIPYASTESYDNYEAAVQKGLPDIKVNSIHHYSKEREAIEKAEAIMVGGGNTFALLNQLYNSNIIESIRAKIKFNAPYIGWSAGSNVACPSIKTTNDMPIIEPRSFEALRLVPFQINPHYTEKTINGHNGESRLQRLKEFLNLNPYSHVVALPEETYLYVKDESIHFYGKYRGKILALGNEVEIGDSTDISQYLV